MLEVIDADTSSVVPYARNPRKNEKAVSSVAASIKEFGFRQPIVVDEDMVVIAGHTRLSAAQSLGLTQVPIHVATGLSEAQKKAYRLADNRVSQDSEWDYDMLKLEFDDLLEMDFDLNATGFTGEELNALMTDKTAGLTDPDAVPEPPEDPISKPGDLWLLGNHRLLCGDATIVTDVDNLLDGVKPHLMVTDPPYGVEYDAEWRVKAGVNAPTAAHGKVLNDDNADWAEAWALFPGVVAYVWHGGVHAGVVADSLMKNDFIIRSQIIWAKNSMVMSRGDYHWQHEPCWYAVKKGSKGYYGGGRKQTTIWNIDKPLKSETGHSTQKPVECMRRPIVNNSSEGQAIYEPFSGSGTTIIAGEMEGRSIYAMELSPEYCDIAVKRWEQFTGQTAELEKREAA